MPKKTSPCHLKVVQVDHERPNYLRWFWNLLFAVALLSAARSLYLHNRKAIEANLHRDLPAAPSWH